MLIAACVGIGICIDASTLALTPLLLAATDEQQKKFFGQIIEEKGVAAYCLTEPNAGSDVAGIKSAAIKKGDKYSLVGHQMKAGNADEERDSVAQCKVTTLLSRHSFTLGTNRYVECTS